MEEKKQRLGGFDCIRVFAMLGVIMSHASSAVIMSSKLDNFPFAVLAIGFVLFNICILLPFFFLAGYFSPPSLAKHGRYVFLKQKFVRILIPCILGVIFVAPIMQYDRYLSQTGENHGFVDFLTKHFFTGLGGDFYEQSHYWFLSTLFYLFAIFALVGKTTVEDDCNESNRKDNRLLKIFFACVISVVCYSLVVKFLDPDEVLTAYFYIFTFMTPRLASYILMFILGVCAYREKWFSPERKKYTLLYFIITVVCLPTFFFYYFIFSQNVPKDIDIILKGFFVTVSTIISTLFLLNMFSGMKSEPPKIIKKIAALSYGIYWWHYPIVIFGYKFLMKNNYFAACHSLVRFFAITFLTLLISSLIHITVMKLVNKLIK